MSELPEHLEKRGADEEEVGAEHGDVTGAWRIVRNGVLLCVGLLAVVYVAYL